MAKIKDSKKYKTSPFILVGWVVSVVALLSVIFVISYRPQTDEAKPEESSEPTQVEQSQKEEAKTTTEEKKETTKKKTTTKSTTSSNKSTTSSSKNTTSTTKKKDTTKKETTETPTAETTCAYKAVYGNKSVQDVVEEDYLVVRYREQYEEAQKAYEEAVKLYSESTSQVYKNKITTAEFARDKARNLYNTQYQGRVEYYGSLYQKCK